MLDTYTYKFEGHENNEEVQKKMDFIMNMLLYKTGYYIYEIGYRAESHAIVVLYSKPEPEKGKRALGSNCFPIARACTEEQKFVLNMIGASCPGETIAQFLYVACNMLNGNRSYSGDFKLANGHGYKFTLQVDERGNLVEFSKKESKE